MEDMVQIPTGTLTLSGRFHSAANRRAVLVTHPHPLYGGNMDNPVVNATIQTYMDSGYATLRFNFRGVGQSQGTWDGGIGEQADVAAAVDFLRDRGCGPIDLAGYSFGAWANCSARSRLGAIRQMVMISPPVAAMPFEENLSIPELALVVTGDRDDIAPPAVVAQWIATWNPLARFEPLPGVDHFYSGAIEKLRQRISDWLSAAQQ